MKLIYSKSVYTKEDVNKVFLSRFARSLELSEAFKVYVSFEETPSEFIVSVNDGFYKKLDSLMTQAVDVASKLTMALSLVDAQSKIKSIQDGADFIRSKVMATAPLASEVTDKEDGFGHNSLPTEPLAPSVQVVEPAVPAKPRSPATVAAMAKLRKEQIVLLKGVASSTDFTIGHITSHKVPEFVGVDAKGKPCVQFIDNPDHVFVVMKLDGADTHRLSVKTDFMYKIPASEILD